MSDLPRLRQAEGQARRKEAVLMANKVRLDHNSPKPPSNKAFSSASRVLGRALNRDVRMEEEDAFVATIVGTSEDPKFSAEGGILSIT